MGRHGRILVAALVITVAAGCSTDQEISVESYARSCTADADCMLIEVGDPCSCACNFGAIQKSEASRYEVDLRDRDCQRGCKLSPECTACKKPAVYCAAKLCSVRADLQDAGVETRADAPIDADVGALEALLATTCSQDVDCKNPLLACSVTKHCALRCAAGSTCKGGESCLPDGTCKLCGDGLCDPIEKVTPALCPEDCS